MHCEILIRKLIGQRNISIGDGDSINENDAVFIKIISGEDLEGYILFLTDIPLRLVRIPHDGSTPFDFHYTIDETSVRDYFISQNFESVFNEYKSPFIINDTGSNLFYYKLFINYPIGRCEVTLYDPDYEIKIKSLYLNIISSKIKDTEFISLVNYIEKKGNDVWAKFSLIRQEAISGNLKESLDWLIIFCENLLFNLKNKYLEYFKDDKITILHPDQEIILYNEDVSIGQESIIWLTQNLDTLIPTSVHDSNKIIINNKRVIPFEISGLKYVEDTNIPENRFIHGFLSDILSFLSDISGKIEQSFKQSPPIFFEEYIDFYSKKSKLKAHGEITKDALLVKDFFEKEIPANDETIEYLSTNRIEIKEHYLYIYEKYIEWSQSRFAEFSMKSSYFKGIERLDNLFERACFYKIVDSLTELNYKVEIVQCSSQNQPQVVKFTKNNKENLLYYQCVPEYLDTAKRGSRNLQPDFILELFNEDIIILDAKYKRESNVLKYDIPELTLKYLHGIHDRNGGWNNFTGLLILFPDKESRSSFYHKPKYTIDGPKQVKPIIGSVGISFIDKYNTLTKLLNLLLTT